MPDPLSKAPQPGAFSHAEIVQVLYGLMVCVLLAALDQTAVIPAVPAMGKDLGAFSGLSWIVAAYLIASTISTPIYAKLSDLYGRKKLLMTCLGMFILTSVLCGAAQTLDQLIWLRAIQGLGGGGLMTLTQAAIADVVAPRERGRYQAYISVAWGFASLSGPLIGGFIVEATSWRWIFWLNLPVGAWAMWMCHKGLNRLTVPKLGRKPRLDIVGMGLLTGALLALLLALGWGGEVYPWGSREILGLVGAGVVLILLLIGQERRAKDPLLPPRVFASSSFIASTIISTITSLLLFTVLFSIPLYFQLARGTTAAESGLYLAPFLLSSTLGNVIASRWAKRYGTIRTGMRVSTAVAFVGLIALALLPATAPVWVVVTTMILTAPGIGGCFINSIMGAQNALPQGDMGAGTGAVLVLRSVGGASGSTLAGALLAAALTASHQAAGVEPALLSSSFSTVYAVAAMFAGISLITAFLMPNTALRETTHDVPVGE
jgi:EmrB/QacA subfamily drug resistance transporter